MNEKISLKTKTFKVILIVSLILIMLGSATGLALYGYASLHNYKNESRHLINYTLSLEDQKYLEKIFKNTREVFYSLPEDVRSDPKSDKFIESVIPLVDKDYLKARNILVKCREKTEQKNVSFMFTNSKPESIVYVVDGDKEEWAFLPGQWIKADIDSIESIEESTWKLNITHNDEYGWVGTDYAALRDSKGKQIGYVVMDLDLNDFLGRVFGFLVVLLPAAVIVVLLLAFLASRLLKKHIISHLTAMADAAREYTERDKVEQPDDAPYVFESLGINTSDELEELWRSMSEMEMDVRDTMIRLRNMTAEQERLGTELSIATKIQEGTLPKEFPAFEDRNEFDIYASMTPAKEVGGDLYDFFMVDDDHLAAVIGDVSGKGVSAALFMVIAKTLLKYQTQLGKMDPAEVFNQVNNKLIDINKANMFVTTWMGILTISTGELKYANAGHEYPAICRAGERYELFPDVHGMALASFRGMMYQSGSIQLDPGDSIFVFTDGVTEANDIDEDMFEKERLLEALNRDPDADPDIIIRNVHEALDEFVKDAPQFDDTTMLCLKYFG